MVPGYSRLWLGVLASVLAGISSGRGQSVTEGSAPHNLEIPLSQRLHEATGASRCEVCHRAEVEGYARSAMAHSLRRAGNEPDGKVITPDTTITMDSSPDGYWQRLQSGGETTSYRIDYVIGSGSHASGYLLDLGGHLFQSPVAYYKSRNAYDLAPGYEGKPNPDFTRPVTEGCLFCHSGMALHVPDTSNGYRSPPFSAEAISCERCHGSAEKHLSDPMAGTIINPAKLNSAARDSICEQCHLLGVGRVLNPGKKFFDFRAGERLEDVFTTYCNALLPGAGGGKFKVISHVEQLARSTCARESNGQMWCGTCHDPHDKPLDPIRFYRSKCLSCHVSNFAPSHPDRNSNCIGCHMPRRNARDGGHTAFTDHRIQRRPQPQPDLPADTDIAAWREPAPELQKRNLGIAYINVGLERRSPPFLIRGYRMLTEVQTQFVNDSEMFTAIGNALLLARKTSEAELAFERVLQLDPDSAPGETNAAAAYLQAGDTDSAITHLQRAIARDPLHLAADAPLIELYRKQGNTAKAEDLSQRLSSVIDKQSLPDERSKGTPTADSSETAEAIFKNIQVLKGVPSDQLIPAMRFITSSLGVQCGYCHVQDHFEKDDKKPKLIARNMMRMMLAIDRDSFKGNRDITCYSCHRGSPKPESIPIIASQPQPQRPSDPDSEKLETDLPTADEVLDNYVRALGGADAIEKVSSRIEKGSTMLNGKTISIEIVGQSPGKRALIQHLSPQDSMTVVNGHQGWSSIANHPVREMQGAVLDAAEMDADLQFPLHIKRLFAELRVEYPEKVADREAYVVMGLRNGVPPVRFYFDEQSGLLLRTVHYAESPLGLDPAQIDYEDYRDVDGLQVPFRWTIAQPGRKSTTQLKEIEQNVPIDDNEFTNPTQ